MPTSEEARGRLVGVANALRQALSDLNEYGDHIDRHIATQGDGCPYGEVSDGLNALVAILWPDDAETILYHVFASGLSVTEAVETVERERLRWAQRAEDDRNESIGFLLTDWLSERCSRISDRSSNTNQDWQAAIEAAKEHATFLGIEWSDEFIPSYVRDLLAIGD